MKQPLLPILIQDWPLSGSAGFEVGKCMLDVKKFSQVSWTIENAFWCGVVSTSASTKSVLLLQFEVRFINSLGWRWFWKYVIILGFPAMKLCQCPLTFVIYHFPSIELLSAYFGQEPKLASKSHYCLPIQEHLQHLDVSNCLNHLL